MNLIKLTIWIHLGLVIPNSSTHPNIFVGYISYQALYYMHIHYIYIYINIQLCILKLSRSYPIKSSTCRWSHHMRNHLQSSALCATSGAKSMDVKQMKLIQINNNGNMMLMWISYDFICFHMIYWDNKKMNC